MATYSFKLQITEEKTVLATIDTAANEVRIEGSMPALSSAEYDLCQSLIATCRNAIATAPLLEIELKKTD